MGTPIIDDRPRYLGASLAYMMREGGYHDRLCGLPAQQPTDEAYMQGYLDCMALEDAAAVYCPINNCLTITN